MKKCLDFVSNAGRPTLIVRGHLLESVQIMGMVEGRPSCLVIASPASAAVLIHPVVAATESFADSRTNCQGFLVT